MQTCVSVHVGMDYQLAVADLTVVLCYLTLPLILSQKPVLLSPFDISGIGPVFLIEPGLTQLIEPSKSHTEQEKLKPTNGDHARCSCTVPLVNTHGCFIQSS